MAVVVAEVRDANIHIVSLKLCVNAYNICVCKGNANTYTLTLTATTDMRGKCRKHYRFGPVPNLVTYIYTIKRIPVSVLGWLGMIACVSEEAAGVSCKFWIVITV